MGLSASEVAGVAAGLGRELDGGQAEGLAVYLGLLEKWNRVTNLVGKRDWRDILADLVADSWHLADYLAGLDWAGNGPGGPVVFDLGAGAGLPGIPLRVFWDAGEYYLIEPRRKRAAFLEAAVAAMRLGRTFVVEARAEDVPRLGLAGGRRADAAVSRAFLPWREYAAVASGLVREGGRIVVMASAGPPSAEDAGAEYRVAAGVEYAAPGGRRYLWSLMPLSAPSAEF